VKDVPPCSGFGDADAVSEVEAGFVSTPLFKFNVMVPGPLTTTMVGSFEPEHVNPPEQLQLEIE
jgi:hypothetical protein